MCVCVCVCVFYQILVCPVKEVVEADTHFSDNAGNIYHGNWFLIFDRVQLFRKQLRQKKGALKQRHDTLSSHGWTVVISQTISWVSQVRLATVARISVFIE